MSGPLGPADAPAIAEVVAAVASVTGLAAGVGTAATYLPGQRVGGVRVGGAGIALHIVVGTDTGSLPAVADQVRAALRGRFPTAGQIDIFIDDIADPLPPAAPDDTPPPKNDPTGRETPDPTPGADSDRSPSADQIGAPPPARSDTHPDTPHPDTGPGGSTDSLVSAADAAVATQDVTDEPAVDSNEPIEPLALEPPPPIAAPAALPEAPAGDRPITERDT